MQSLLLICTEKPRYYIEAVFRSDNNKYFIKMRSYYKNIGWILILAIAITELGYLLDNDLPYDKMSTTILEFSFLTMIVFGVTRIKMIV